MLSEYSVDPITRLNTIHMIMDVNRIEWGIAEELEAGINRFSTAQDYTNKATKLAYNICCNRELLNDYSPSELASLPDALMASSILKQIQQEESDRATAIIQMLKEKYDNVNSTDIKSTTLKCMNCGSADISWQQKQTRGADEAMTIFCTCMGCGMRWKMS